MSDFVLRFPSEFDDYAWEVEAKGWLDGVEVVWEGAVIRLTVYDPVRLAQEIEEEVAASRVLAFSNLVVVPAVTRTVMERAVRSLIETGEIRKLSSS
jgi:hypothetical protein